MEEMSTLCCTYSRIMCAKPYSADLEIMYLSLYIGIELKYKLRIINYLFIIICRFLKIGTQDLRY